MRKMGILSVALFLATCSIPAWAQVTFDKVQIRMTRPIFCTNRSESLHRSLGL